MPKSKLAATAASSKPKKTSTTTATKTTIPKSVLDKIVHAIQQHPPNQNGDVSRASIVKYLKSEFDFDKAPQIKLALKRGVSTGVLEQTNQSFAVKGDAKRIPPPGEPLQIHDIQEGTGPAAAPGDFVTVQYKGTLEDGTQFDAAKSFLFELGAGDVIKGWDQGVVGMAVGAKRKLVVPPHLGYGKRGSAPDIPPSATLLFSIGMKKITTR
jgi:FKBP-type peptidyl-prolyl cis-trans isomerase